MHRLPEMLDNGLRSLETVIMDSGFWNTSENGFWSLETVIYILDSSVWKLSDIGFRSLETVE